MNEKNTSMENIHLLLFLINALLALTLISEFLMFDSLPWS